MTQTNNQQVVGAGLRGAQIPQIYPFWKNTRCRWRTLDHGRDSASSKAIIFFPHLRALIFLISSPRLVMLPTFNQRRCSIFCSMCHFQYSGMHCYYFDYIGKAKILWSIDRRSWLDDDTVWSTSLSIISGAGLTYLWIFTYVGGSPVGVSGEESKSTFVISHSVTLTFIWRRSSHPWLHYTGDRHTTTPFNMESLDASQLAYEELLKPTFVGMVLRRRRSAGRRGICMNREEASL